jgi:hypothetical protein
MSKSGDRGNWTGMCFCSKSVLYSLKRSDLFHTSRFHKIQQRPQHRFLPDTDRHATPPGLRYPLPCKTVNRLSLIASVPFHATGPRSLCNHHCSWPLKILHFFTSPSGNNTSTLWLSRYSKCRDSIWIRQRPLLSKVFSIHLSTSDLMVA